MRFVNCSPMLRVAASRLVLASIAMGLGLILSGCSSARNTPPASWAGANPPVPAPANQQSAYVAEAGDPIKDAPVEPGKQGNTTPDDPTEPYSPNYGGARNRPPVHVSDAAPIDRSADEPTSPVSRLPDGSRSYFRRATTTASAD
jgi:hypothetical protein